VAPHWKALPHGQRSAARVGEGVGREREVDLAISATLRRGRIGQAWW
jgi:hypothetical protein